MNEECVKIKHLKYPRARNNCETMLRIFPFVLIPYHWNAGPRASRTSDVLGSCSCFIYKSLLLTATNNNKFVVNGKTLRVLEKEYSLAKNLLRDTRRFELSLHENSVLSKENGFFGWHKAEKKFARGSVRILDMNLVHST